MEAHARAGERERTEYKFDTAEGHKTTTNAVQNTVLHRNTGSGYVGVPCRTRRILLDLHNDDIAWILVGHSTATAAEVSSNTAMMFGVAILIYSGL